MPFNKFIEEETKAYANTILGSKPLLDIGNDCLVLGSFIYFRPALNNLKHARARNFSLESIDLNLTPDRTISSLIGKRKREVSALYTSVYLSKFHYIFSTEIPFSRVMGDMSHMTCKKQSERKTR